MGGEFVLEDALVVTMDERRSVYRDGYVWVRGDRIHEVGTKPGLRAGTDVPRISLGGHHIVMPGIVNGHCHVECSVVRGVMDDQAVERRRGGTGLLWRTRREMQPAAYGTGAAVSLLDLLQRGVTTTAQTTIVDRDPHSVDAVFEAIHGSGLRVLAGRSFMDDPTCDWAPADLHDTPQQAIAEIRRLRERWDGDRVQVVPDAIHDLYCSESMVRELHAYGASEGIPFLMHLAVSESEAVYAEQRYGKRTIFQLDDWSVLGHGTVLAHAVQVDRDEIQVLAQRGTGLAVCAVSCTFSGGGVAPLGEMIAAGARVGFGTDGPETNNSLDPWTNAKMAIFLQRLTRSEPEWGSADLALSLLTIGAARALHIDDRVGSLEAGKQADIVCIDLDRPALVPRESILSNLIYSPDSAAVRHVFVAGEQLLKDGEPLRVDAAEVVAKGQQEAARAAGPSGLAESVALRGGWTWRD